MMAPINLMFGFLVLVAGCVTVNSPPADVFKTLTPGINLNWLPCGTKFACTLLKVSLDYLHPTGSFASIALLKLPASTTPYKGMVLANPGGPGLSGVDWLLSNADLAKRVIGTDYDIVAFDPRGIGSTTPQALCPGDTASKKRSIVFPTQSGFSNLLDPSLSVSYDYYQEFGSGCNGSMGGYTQAGPHMSTSVVVKDMAAILDAYAKTPAGKSVSNPTLLNFWGLSYGSFIGQTFVSMYPSRVGRIVLDGVLDAADYISGDALKNILLTDSAFASFFSYCYAAGPAKCAYATGASSASDISARFQRSITVLNPQVASNKHWANNTDITKALTLVKTGLEQAVYQPIVTFPLVSQMLLAVESGLVGFNYEDFATNVGPFVDNIKATNQGGLDEWAAGVACSDTGGVLYGKSYASFKANTVALEAESFVAGDLWEISRLICAGWPIKGVERYTGPFPSQSSTSTPILFVSNILDPITPLPNGISAHSSYPGSQLLQIAGVGHASAGSANTCAFNAMNNYFQNGILPPGNAKDGTAWCGQEPGPWGVTIPSGLSKRDASIEDGLAQLRARSTFTTKCRGRARFCIGPEKRESSVEAGPAE